MDVKRTISISEARKRIFDIAEEVQAPHKVYTLTAGGKPKAIIMSAEEYESWVETMNVLADFPDIDQEIRETKKAWETGEWKKWPTLDDLKRDWGMAIKVAETPKRKYGVHTPSKTKGKKKP